MEPSAKKIALVQDDPWLEPYENDIKERHQRFLNRVKEIEKIYGTLGKFADAHHYLGVNYDKKLKGWWYREWAPKAHALWLVGDFNNWNRDAHPLKKLDGGIWEIFLPDAEYKDTFKHGSLVKVRIAADNGDQLRIPACITRAVQDPVTYEFSGQVWAPEKNFKWTDKAFDLSKVTAPFIYESHTGMAQEKEGLGTYKEFADNILPRIHKLGYNCVQLMAVMEHPYYGSFGYHVANFFAPSSRFGTPEDLKYLVNKAHELNIAVIMDVVHSHVVKNVAEGLNDFDGSGNQYFHTGAQGYHELWDSKLFDYGKWEVQQFLLSNLKYWMEEFHFDGFRFDGVTSMLYFHHGMIGFDHYDKYFKDQVDWDAVTYLQMANELIHTLNPHAISIAEDMSGMPGGCRKIEDGGLGFDYRLGMGIPDFWIETLKHKRDEDWNIHEFWNVLNNRRYKEKTIAYTESHDQGLVGDKTLAFWLMDKEMYWHMQVNDPNIIIDRGISLHKLLRLVTAALGGEGYLNFIGNEFGHPEWIDFPRLGNDWSYKYARRQWHLADNPDLKYKYLQSFDESMVKTLKDNHVLEAIPARAINMDTDNKVMVFERNNLYFLLSFSPSNSIPDYRFPVAKGKYKIVLNSDAPEFGGFNRVDTSMQYESFNHNGEEVLSVYLPNRTGLVLKKA
jgi:1,4-alpha-glucan branching enzyme